MATARTRRLAAGAVVAAWSLAGYAVHERGGAIRRALALAEREQGQQSADQHDSRDGASDLISRAAVNASGNLAAQVVAFSHAVSPSVQPVTANHKNGADQHDTRDDQHHADDGAHALPAPFRPISLVEKPLKGVLFHAPTVTGVRPVRNTAHVPNGQWRLA